MSDISTRKAIEVCMSRLRMHGPARDTLAHHLHNAIRQEPETPTDDVDALRAALVEIVEAADVRDDFPRKALMCRLQSITEIARRYI